MSPISRLSVFLRPSIVVVVVVVDIPLVDDAVETISVAMETCKYDNLDFWLTRLRLLLAFVVIRIQSGFVQIT